MPKLDTYKHLNDGQYGKVTIELPIPELAREICSMNYGAHRMLSEFVHILRERDGDSPLADGIEKLLDKGLFY